MFQVASLQFIEKENSFYTVSKRMVISFQETCEKELGKQLVVLRDSKTRWNSLLAMVKRFLEVKTPLAKTLLTLKHIHLLPSDSEIKCLEDMVESLETIETGSLALGRRECSLTKADRIFQFMLEKLEQQSSEISSRLLERLRIRILERREEVLSSLLFFLEDPASYLSALETGNLPLPLAGKNEIARAARDIHVRLFPPSEEQAPVEEERGEREAVPKKKSKAEELDEFLASKSGPPAQEKNPFTPQEILVCLKREIAVFETTSVRPIFLNNVYNSLVTLPPSSIEAERSFSAAGLFITKLRTRLGDNTINNLFFLRSYLKNK